jgi:hypothetical protein
MIMDEVAQCMHLHSSTIYRMKHNIPAFKVSGEWRFSQESIETLDEGKEKAAWALIPLVSRCRCEVSHMGPVHL